jgi:hypothetical protein
MSGAFNNFSSVQRNKNFFLVARSKNRLRVKDKPPTDAEAGGGKSLVN